MSNERLLDYDPINGIKTYFSNTGDDFHFRYDFDSVTPEIEASKELAKTDDHWDDGMKKDMVHYAHIPNSVLIRWHVDGVNINDARELIRMSNRPEWRYLKCVDKVHLGK